MTDQELEQRFARLDEMDNRLTLLMLRQQDLLEQQQQMLTSQKEGADVQSKRLDEMSGVVAGLLTAVSEVTDKLNGVIGFLGK